MRPDERSGPPDGCWAHRSGAVRARATVVGADLVVEATLPHPLLVELAEPLLRGHARLHALAVTLVSSDPPAVDWTDPSRSAAARLVVEGCLWSAAGHRPAEVVRTVLDGDTLRWAGVPGSSADPLDAADPDGRLAAVRHRLRGRPPRASSPPSGGRPLGHDLVVLAEQLRCRACGHRYGTPTGTLLDRVLDVRTPLAEVVGVRPGTEHLELRRRVCPGCARQLHVEILSTTDSGDDWFPLP